MLKTEDSLSAVDQVPRDNLKTTQTPQTFFLNEILDVHKEATAKGISNSIASCSLYVELGRKVYLSIGSEKNLKLTTTEDIDIFTALLHTKRPDWLRQ